MGAVLATALGVDMVYCYVRDGTLPIDIRSWHASRTEAGSNPMGEQGWGKVVDGGARVFGFPLATEGGFAAA